MELKKRCPVCQHLNQAQDVMCGKCLTDISAVSPTSGQPPQAPESSAGTESPEQPPGVTDKQGGAVQGPWLVLSTKEFRIRVKDGDIVGRNGVGQEHFTKFPGISRKHAIFTLKEGDWYIEDLNSTNGTYKNGKMLSPDSKHLLKVGDLLGISKKVTFEIRTDDSEGR